MGGPPAAVCQWVFEEAARVSSHVLWSACGCSSLRYRGPGQSVAPQPSCPGSSWRQGSHLPYTSTGLLRQQRHLTIRKMAGWHVSGVPSATEVAVRAWLQGYPTLGAAVQRRPRRQQCCDRGLGRCPRNHVKVKGEETPQDNPQRRQ